MSNFSLDDLDEIIANSNFRKRVQQKREIEHIERMTMGESIFRYTVEDIIEFYKVFDRFPNRNDFIKVMADEYDAISVSDIVLMWQCFDYADNKRMSNEKY